MGRSMFGMEAELAIGATAPNRSIPADRVVAALMKHAQQRLPHLRGGGTRIFLANGGLLYVDVGSHIEWATAECTNPTETVCHLLAGERMVADLAERVRGELGAEEVQILRTNVDYRAGTTWGCHESYLASRPVGAYASWLIPHLASRIVYTGSGGLDPASPGIRLSLSPRVAHLQHAMSTESTSNRGIYHTRNEPLCNGYSRIHVLAGDNACSQRATWLKVGTTALIVALAERMLPAACPITLPDPVDAMQRFARDHRHRAFVRLNDGAVIALTSVEIQRRLLAMVELHAGSAGFPEWAQPICVAWKKALDLVDSGIIRESHAFDWPLKFALFRREMSRHGYTEDALAAWSSALEGLSCHLPAGFVWPAADGHAWIDRLRSAGALPAATIDREERSLAAYGLSWHDFDALTTLRHDLCAMDVRFGEIGAGTFESLDRQDLLPDHRIVSEAAIAHAGTDAPMGTRAGVRARWVGNLSRQRERFSCAWSAINSGNLRLDLSDPFTTTARWDRVPADWRTRE